ncbi:hypothetical protein U737_09690 [Methylomonas sp. LW13]|uniref:hypothetical protein n=1 Tax=unclassified Methylomonas TaxID=2608980 RepID=UPI00051C03EC|nr:hypothetical protein [Methylomonas sp. LW13]QBC27151.1 hypothetical protein U737_09690 [Methylomonas sp. LW13]
MLNEEHIATYRQAKTDIDSLNGRLIEKRQAVVGAQRQIAEYQQTIGEIGEQLRIEDLALESPSRLRQPTLTEEQYEAQRQTAVELEAKLPALQSQIDQANREIRRLDLELSGLHNTMNYAQAQIAVGMVNQSVDQLIETANDSFKNLVMALIAREGRSQGYTLEEKDFFKRETSHLLCELLYQRAFGVGPNGYEMPDLHHATAHVIGVIETAPH